MMSTQLRWIAAALLVLSASWFAFDKVVIREDALDLLPGSRVRADLVLLQEIGLANRVFLSLEGAADSGDNLRSSARRIGERLIASPLFSSVVHRLPQGFEYALSETLFPCLPGLLGPEDLAWLASSITDEGVRQVIQSNFSLLNSPAGMAVKDHVIRDPFGLLPHFLNRLKNLRGELAVTVQDGFFISQDGRHCLLWAESAASLTDSQQARNIDAYLKEVLSTELEPGISARIIGPLPHTLANATTIERDLQRLLPLAFITLLLLLLLTLKSWRALLVVAVPFLAAPVAIAVMGLIFGSVSIMALGFGIVLLGISVDFAVHIYLAQTRGNGPQETRLASVREPILMASATTLGVFVVLLFSSVPAHQQMAVLALIGVSVAVIFSWFLVPSLAGSGEPVLVESGTMSEDAVKLPRGFGLVGFVLWIGLLISGGLAWPMLHFSGDLRAMDVPSAMIAEDETVFKATWGQSDSQAFIVAEARDLVAVLDLNDAIFAHAADLNISGVHSLSGILSGPAVQERNWKAWQDFWDANRADVSERFQRIGPEVGFVPHAFDPFFEWLRGEAGVMEPDFLLHGPLAPLFLSMIHFSPGKEGAAVEKRVLMTTLADDTAKLQEAGEGFEKTMRGVRIMSPAGWRQDVEHLLQRDIVRLSMFAGGLIVLLVAFFFREIRGAVGALAPVLSALAAMAVYDFFTTQDLNLMHLLMAIMVIGLAVDYGIFAVCAARQVVDRSAILGVSICAASTISGFGVLALAVHPALHSLGATVLVGIGAAWPTAVCVTPFIAGSQKGSGR